MALIRLETRFRAPIERVFDLARSVEAHLASAGETGERVVAGRAEGLFESGDEVTWEGRHFGQKQQLSVRVTKLERPYFFEDEMLRGGFRMMKHRHFFEEVEGRTVMRDEFEYRAPLGFLGRLAEDSFLTAYLRRFLRDRANRLKEMAESEEWKSILPEEKIGVHSAGVSS